MAQQLVHDLECKGLLDVYSLFEASMVHIKAPYPVNSLTLWFTVECGVTQIICITETEAAQVYVAAIS